MLKNGKVLTRNKKMANALSKRGKAIRTHSGRLKRQNGVRGNHGAGNSSYEWS